MTAWREGLALLLLLATFAQPRWPLARPRVDAVVVLDVTQSMNVVDQAQDGQPLSRLAFAKQALQAALAQLPCGSRLGWAIFTEARSYLLSTPLEVCAHRTELRAILAGLDGRMAWSGNSEIAKGLHSAFGVAQALPDKPALLFVTDGQEAPPLDAKYRPRFDDRGAETPGWIVGVGDLRASPIPKTDPTGRPLGWWGADEVSQVDPRRRGRGGSVGDERMSDDAPIAAGIGATPGAEHLSALREAYLQVLAGDYGLGYLRLRSVDDLAAALRLPALARNVSAPVDLRPALGLLALGLLAWPYGLALVTGLRRRARR